MKDQDIVIVGEYNTRNEAEVIRSLLESADIPAFATADDAGGLYGFNFSLSAAGGAKVYVKHSDLVAAQEVLRKATQE